jgi:hypothetical protein
LALYNRFSQFIEPDAQFVISSKLLFHAFNHTAYRAAVVDLKMAANFF